MRCDTEREGVTRTRGRRMEGEQQQTKHKLAEFEPEVEQSLGQLMEEINILNLEGRVFCFNPKEAKKRVSEIKFDELKDHSVIVRPHQDFRQPSLLAYRVLQAIFTKITQQPYPYDDTVTFTMRELTRLVRREWSGSKGTKELYEAIMQLQSTVIQCSLFNKDAKEWELATFSIVSRARFSIQAENNALRVCMICLDREIVKSLCARHVAYFNLDRLAQLDVIGMVMYKRLFFHFANIYHPHKQTKKEHLVYHKDYETMCREWLGGLTPQKHKSQIIRDQLGRHIDALIRTGIIRKGEIEKKKDGTGYKLVFVAGDGFFDDYEAYYVNRKSSARTAATEMLDEIREPMQVVAYFHEMLGHSGNRFEESELRYAALLLKGSSLQEVRDLAEYAVEQARSTNFDPRSFGAVSKYRDQWQQDRERRRIFERKRAVIGECPHCNEQGMVTMKTRTGAITMCPCPHDVEVLGAYEEREGLRRLSN